MNRRYRIVLLSSSVLIAIVATFGTWIHFRSPEAVAVEDSSAVWMALLKGFDGDVVYVGSDQSSAYFRLGHFFWSYYRVPACAAHLPETFPVGRQPGYVVHLHFENGNIRNLISECVRYAGNVLGKLDRN